MSSMKQTELWKNFRLGEELSVSGAFIYNGLRRFHEMRKLDYEDELFEFFYSISVGLERLLKIAIILYDHHDTIDQEQLEKSLITHNHLDLASRLRAHTTVNFGQAHTELLQLLARFYKSFRYDRFTLTSTYDVRKERQALCAWIENHLHIKIEVDSVLMGTPNDDRYRKFVRNIVVKIARDLYEIVQRRSRELNLYTYELRHGSKAESVFLRSVDIAHEDVLWKELLVFLMNTEDNSGYLKFLRSIEPLDFDPALVDEYLDCFKSDASKSQVMDELEQLYEDLEGNVGERLEMISVIGAPNVYFDEDEDVQKEPDDE